MTTSTYESVTARVSVPGIPAGSITVGSCGSIPYGAYGGDPAPSSVTRSYNPYEEVRQLYDPTKGRKFSELKETGAILFSPYLNSLVKVTDSLSSREKLRHRYYQLVVTCNSTPPTCYVGPLIDLKPTWTENDDFSSLSSYLTTIGQARPSFDQDVLDAISSTQQAAFSQALNAYDFLTELGELQETVSFLGSKMKEGSALISKFVQKDEPAWRSGRRSNAKTLMRSGDAAMRKLGKRWMEYRYALMPLLYSFNDVSKLLKDKADLYQTERSKEVIDLNFTQELSPTYNGLSVDSEGKITVRSLTKARFDLGALQRLVSVVGLNPFRTAWELVPLSFVVDWFLNVGDAITSLTGIDYSSERLGTTSVRESSKFTYTHHETFTWDHTQSWTQNPCGTRPPAAHNHYDRDWHNVVRVVETESYSRTLWNRPTPKLVFNPYLNWKRFIDGFVLGYQPTKKILRSLR